MVRVLPFFDRWSVSEGVRCTGFVNIRNNDMKTVLQKRLMILQVIQTLSSWVARRVNRGLSMVIMMFGLVALSQAALAKEAGIAHEAAGAQLQKASGTIQKCLSALDKVGSNAQLESILKDIELKIQRGKVDALDASATLAEINKAAGKPIDLTAGELKLCVTAYQSQQQLAATSNRKLFKSQSGGYPSCSGACPNPSSPGGICCGGDTCASACGPEGSNCYAYCEPSCFPSDATVRLEGGATKLMRDLMIGDRVQVVRADGSIAYEDVYLMTHKDTNKVSPYLQIVLATGKTLTLSPRHFVPTVQGSDASWDARVLVGANEIKVGDTIWYQNETGAMALAVVSQVAHVTGVGAFNPLTASGTIVVDGVVASAHSDWFLDGIVSADAQGKVYQAIMAPVRGIYSVIGPQRMRTVTEEWGVVDFVRDNGLVTLLSLVGLSAALFLGGRAVWRRRGQWKRASQGLSDELPLVHQATKS